MVDCFLQALEAADFKRRDASDLCVHAQLVSGSRNPGATGEKTEKPEDWLPKHAIFFSTV